MATDKDIATSDKVATTSASHHPEKAEPRDVKTVNLTSKAGTKVTVSADLADHLKAQGFK